MPPRRSCFNSHHGRSLNDPFRFNATTAFLLLGGTKHFVNDPRCFNATTAFLLP